MTVETTHSAELRGMERGAGGRDLTTTTGHVAPRRRAVGCRGKRRVIHTCSCPSGGGLVTGLAVGNGSVERRIGPASGLLRRRTK